LPGAQILDGLLELRHELADVALLRKRKELKGKKSVAEAALREA